MKKVLVIVLFVVMFQGCATVGSKETASPIAQKGCEVYCEAGKTLEQCEKESQEFIGFHCKAVHDPEWGRERFPMKDPGGNLTHTEVMKDRIVQSIGMPPVRGVWTIRKK